MSIDRRRIAVPSGDARVPVESAGVSERSPTLASASSLRSMIQAVIGDARAPRAVRNACHQLMVAIERNDQTLVEEGMANLNHVAARTDYPLPRVPHVEGEPP